MVGEKGSHLEEEKREAAEKASGAGPKGAIHGEAETPTQQQARTNSDVGAQPDPRADEETIRRLEAEIDRLSVADHLMLMLQSLSALALNNLGFAKESRGRRDFEQARLAIDAFKALVGVMEPIRSEEEVRAHKAVLAQLQMTYAATLARAAGSTDPGRDAGQAGGGHEAPGTQEARSEEAS